jgi:hypothetical protein
MKSLGNKFRESMNTHWTHCWEHSFKLIWDDALNKISDLKAVIDKVKKIVKKLHASPKALASFLQRQRTANPQKEATTIPTDIVTRWFPMLKTIQRTVEHRLKLNETTADPEFKELFREKDNPRESKTAWRITEDDTEWLMELEHDMAKIKSVAGVLEGDTYPTINLVLPTYAFLKAHFAEGRGRRRESFGCVFFKLFEEKITEKVQIALFDSC